MHSWIQTTPWSIQMFPYDHHVRFTCEWCLRTRLFL
jgi:hypothetical protein